MCQSPLLMNMEAPLHVMLPTTLALALQPFIRAHGDVAAACMAAATVSQIPDNSLFLYAAKSLLVQCVLLLLRRLAQTCISWQYRYCCGAVASGSLHLQYSALLPLLLLLSPPAHPLYPSRVASPAAALAIASAMYLGSGSVVSPMPRLMILASGWASWCARRLRAICRHGQITRT